jgi:hypothetical protein
VAIHSSGQIIFGFTHIEDITQDVGEVVDEVAGGASGMGVGRIVVVDDRASEGQTAGVYVTDFTAGSLAMVCVFTYIYSLLIEKYLCKC